MSPLEQMLTRHEGFKSGVYKDSRGFNTVGFGRCLDTNPLTRDEALYLMQGPLTAARTDLVTSFAWFPILDAIRQAVLMDLCYNIGIAGVLGFKKMISAMAAGDYDSAAAELMNSQYATQVGSRAKELAQMLKTGDWQRGY